MSEQEARVSIEQMTLEGYKNLSSWNERDKQTVASFDRLFLPVTIGAWAIALAKYSEYFIHVYIGSWLLSTFWVFLSWRYWDRQNDRFRVMKKIECCLGFKAHLLISDELKSPRDITLRWWFYAITMILGAVVVSIKPENCEEILDSYPWVFGGILALATTICCLVYHLKRKQ